MPRAGHGRETQKSRGLGTAVTRPGGGRDVPRPGPWGAAPWFGYTELFISWFSSARMEKGNWSTSEVNGMADAFPYRSVVIPINLPLISKHHPRGEGHSRFSVTSYARLVEKATGQQVSS